LVRAIEDAADTEARTQVMWAATLAGIAFGNAGCHAPHAMSYSVSGLVRDFRAAGYPQDAPMVPHGMSVIVNAPAVVRFTAPACPDRHLDATHLLGGETRGAREADAGAILAERLIALMQTARVPNGIGGVGYTAADIPALTEGAYPQQRLLRNAPREIAREDLSVLYEDALAYW
jgi:alcohol dehydrogenase class IV